MCKYESPSYYEATIAEVHDGGTEYTVNWHDGDTQHRRRRTIDVGMVPAAQVYAFIAALLAEVRAAGSWKRYANEPRLQLVVLRKLAESGRAVATRGVATRLFAPRRRVQAMGSRALPDVLFWKILEFWRTDRDP